VVDEREREHVSVVRVYGLDIREERKGERKRKRRKTVQEGRGEGIVRGKRRLWRRRTRQFRRRPGAG
jgi:hypothetical protein